MKNLTNILNTIAQVKPPNICDCKLPTCLGLMGPDSTPVRDLRPTSFSECQEKFRELLDRCDRCEKEETKEECKKQAQSWVVMCQNERASCDGIVRECSEAKGHAQGQVSWPRYACECRSHICTVSRYFDLISNFGCNREILRKMPNSIDSIKDRNRKMCEESVDECLASPAHG